jgi:ketosteroid isomerase-like protein
MNTDKLRVMLAALMLAGTLPAQCDKAKQERSEKALLEMENRWVTALDHRDPKGVDCLLAEDFLDSDASGQLRTRQQVLDAVPKRKTYAQHLEDLRARVYGDTGIVRGVNRISDKEGKEVARVRFTDVFRYRDGQWRAISGHETMVQTEANKSGGSE